MVPRAGRGPSAAAVVAEGVGEEPDSVRAAAAAAAAIAAAIAVAG